MADFALAELSPWAGLWRLGRFGNAAREPGLVIVESPLQAAATLTARRGQAAALLAVGASFGVELPTRPAWAMGASMMFIRTGPDQWLVRGRSSFDELEAELAEFTRSGVLIDQSDGRAVLTISGEQARDALAKGFEIDLHPRSFQPGDAAVTVAAGISAILWQLDDRPTYEVAVPRSMAGSFWEWLSESSAQYGYRIGDGD